MGPTTGLILTQDIAIPVLTNITVAPMTRTVRKISTEVPIGSAEGLRYECAMLRQPVRRS